ncbi:MAG: PilC/PilY family type IV pilus protein [Rhodanobacter sp.]
MLTRNLSQRIRFSMPALLLTLVGGFAAPFVPVAHAASTPTVGTVELSPAPPDETQAVAPNLLVTFDDSGSMMWTKMGDFPPFSAQTYNSNTYQTTSNYEWGGSSQPWRCAAVINPASTSGIGAHAMNGVYYNPSTDYQPPKYEDGTSFPAADATLAAVWVDGIAINRPYNAITVDSTAGYYNNPDLNGSSNDSEITNLTATNSSSRWSCGGSNLNYTGYPGDYGATGESDGWGTYSATSGNNGTFTPAASPMNGTTGTLSDGTQVTYSKGGPYYYQFKSKMLSSITVNATTGVPTAAGLAALYNAANWEAVPITNTSVKMSDGATVNQWQNFANWYAYYRARNLMARSSLSLVFSNFGTTTSSNIRVAWQNLGNNNNFNSTNPQLPSSEIIAGLDDTTAYTQSDGSTSTYRAAFYNWIFNVVANNGTPTRDAIIRAGKFYKRIQSTSAPLTDPYWQPAANGQPGQELACRQNFSLLMTDGYWNEDKTTEKASAFLQTSSSQTLPDNTGYTPISSGNGITAMYYGATQDASGTSDNATMANIAFNYWATDLRPDLAATYPNDKVAPYFSDTTVGVTGSSTAIVNSDNPGATPEVYWNPTNDPASWPHMDGFYVTLGAGGLMNSQPKDPDCTQPGFDGTDGDDDYCDLRTGKSNSSGSTGWPTPNGDANGGNGEAQNVDDLWHAAVNSRGDFFTAANPQTLETDLSNILGNIVARVSMASLSDVNASVLSAGALSFNTGYSSADWTGSLIANLLNSDGTPGILAWNAQTNLDSTQPTSRQILTASLVTTNGVTGIAGMSFESGSAFDTSETTGLMTPASAGTNDTQANRVNYLRGVTTEETAGLMRKRDHILGPIIDSQALYVSSATGGYTDTWPTTINGATVSAPEMGTSAQSYDTFVTNEQSRAPMVYVGANDGMLHAFSAPVPTCTQTDPTTGYCTASTNPTTIAPIVAAGFEQWAYVPRAVYANLGNLTSKSSFKFAPTVDGTPVVRDVFFHENNDAEWHTILTGGLALGGRGVYALDVTNPGTVNETNAATNVLWEFDADATASTGCIAIKGSSGDSTGCNPADLGFTYGQPNVGRLAYDGDWVVLVPSGYFPDCTKTDKPTICSSSAPPTPPTDSTGNTFSSLFVLDAQTGAMIAELKTPTGISGVTSYGLAAPVLGDYNNDQVDDVAFAGDLAGNLWRFDLSDPSPSNWKVTLAYQPPTQGTQPITVMPRLFPDPVTNRFMVVFGTGKYLGAGDNTSNSEATQAVYGIRDELSGGIPETITQGELVQQTLSQSAGTGVNAGATLRSITSNPVAATNGGWYFNLQTTNSSGTVTDAGERVVVTPAAVFNTNTAIISTVIPGSTDPCNPVVNGAIMFIDATSGGPGTGVSSLGGVPYVGALVNNVRTNGTLSVTTVVGGGQTILPGITLTGKTSNSSQPLTGNAPIWRRRSWSILNNDQ